MGLLSWLVVGLIAGWLAGVIMKGSGYGLVGDIIIGMVGALLGGWIAGALFGIPEPIGGISLVTILVALFGSIVLIAILRLISGRRVV